MVFIFLAYFTLYNVLQFHGIILKFIRITEVFLLEPTLHKQSLEHLKFIQNVLFFLGKFRCGEMFFIKS